MNRLLFFRYKLLIFSVIPIMFYFTGCLKTENPVKYPLGTFPDSVINMTDINSAYDDYNVSLNQISASLPLVFSSNRGSSGGQFDLVQASYSFQFDKFSGNFKFSSAMAEDAFLTKLIDKAKTPGNDFGPYRLYSSVDGYEYLILSSANAEGNLDLFYLKNRPAYGTVLPEVEGPFPVKLLNTSFDDAYICFDTNLDSAYFASDRNGNFDLFLKKKPAEQDIASWFNLDYAASEMVDSLNTTYDDKCPMVFRKIMVFTSNRPGGFGGYDLYYSVFKKGKWNSPVNLGPRINTSSNEYRPVIGYHPEFNNLFMIFSSDRSGGKGGFDLYFTGVLFP
jgi:hypothetical protein